MEDRTAAEEAVNMILRKTGIYVVLEIQDYAREAIGAAVTLEGAAKLVLDENLPLLIPAKDGDGFERIMVDSRCKGVMTYFRWYDELGNFAQGVGEMRAYFDGEATPYVVQWREMRY